MTASVSLRPGTSIADPDNPSHVLKPTAAGEMPVSASLVLDPTNLATGAKQDTGNTSLATIATQTTSIATLVGTEYETVAASQTDQVLGGSGAVGDLLNGLLVTPASLDPGAISIKDGGGSAITVFTGGTGSVLSLTPFAIPIGARSAAGAWKVTTGSAVSLIAFGNFT
jgi:hypothetical protein